MQRVLFAALFAALPALALRVATTTSSVWTENSAHPSQKCRAATKSP